jgi:hypothetical protein
MAELEITKEAYDQLLEKLKHWRKEQQRLQRQIQQEANPCQDKPSRELLQAKAQREEVTSRISQLEAKLQQGVRIITNPARRRGEECGRWFVGSCGRCGITIRRFTMRTRNPSPALR